MTAYWVDEPRDVLLVSGADASTYLQSQISQDIRGLGDGDSMYSFVLQPMGKVEALVRIQRRSADEVDQFVIDTDAGFGVPLAARLNRFKIRVKVEIEPAGWRCIAVRGADAAIPGGVAAWGRGDAFDIIGPDAQPPADISEGSIADLELDRVRTGWPAMGREITDATIPAETGFVVPLAVSFTKGCYPGQELVERMDSRGSAAPRFVRRLHGSGPASASVAAGAELLHGDKSVGALTTVVVTPDGWSALAVVARSVQPGETVTIDVAESGARPTAVVEELSPTR